MSFLRVEDSAACDPVSCAMGGNPFGIGGDLEVLALAQGEYLAPGKIFGKGLIYVLDTEGLDE